MPAKGRLSASRRSIDAQLDFAEARQQHPVVESAIHNLEERGLDRVRTHGKAGFARTVALSILAANILRVGVLVRATKGAQLRRLKRRAASRPDNRQPASAQPATGCRQFTLAEIFETVAKWRGNLTLAAISIQQSQQTATCP